MILLLSIFVAALLCGSLALASYFHVLYSEALRIRPREAARSLPFFEEHLQPRLKLEPEQGLQRFVTAKQLCLLLLVLDLVYLSSARRGLHAIELLEVLVLMLALMVLFAYIVPHVLVTRTSGQWALRFVTPTRALSAAVKPLLVIVDFAYSVAELGIETKAPEDAPTQEENLQALIEAGQEEGLLGEEDRELIQSVVEFGDKTVREVMTPRPRIVAIEASASLEELRALLLNERYSRIPVYEGSIDKIQGF